MYVCFALSEGRQKSYWREVPIVGHIYKHDLALDQATFYYTLCLFRCTSKAALKRHITLYSKHQAGAAGGGVKAGICVTIQILR